MCGHVRVAVSVSIVESGRNKSATQGRLVDERAQDAAKTEVVRKLHLASRSFGPVCFGGVPSGVEPAGTETRMEFLD